MLNLMRQKNAQGCKPVAAVIIIAQKIINTAHDDLSAVRVAPQPVVHFDRVNNTVFVEQKREVPAERRDDRLRIQKRLETVKGTALFRIHHAFLRLLRAGEGVLLFPRNFRYRIILSISSVSCILV